MVYWASWVWCWLLSSSPGCVHVQVNHPSLSSVQLGSVIGLKPFPSFASIDFRCRFITDMIFMPSPCCDNSTIITSVVPFCHQCHVSTRCPTTDPETYVIACKGCTRAPRSTSATPATPCNCFTYIDAQPHGIAKPRKMNLPDDGEGALSGGTVECVWPEQTSCLSSSE